MKPLPAWKIQKAYTCDCILHKITETVIDDEFGQTTSSTISYNIKAEIQSITLEDMLYLPAGEIKEGDAFGFFLPVYPIESQDIYVEVNDKITFKGITYLVTGVQDFYMGNTTVYRRGTLRRE